MVLILFLLLYLFILLFVIYSLTGSSEYPFRKRLHRGVGHIPLHSRIFLLEIFHDFGFTFGNVYFVYIFFLSFNRKAKSANILLNFFQPFLSKTYVFKIFVMECHRLCSDKFNINYFNFCVQRICVSVKYYNVIKLY